MITIQEGELHKKLAKGVKTARTLGKPTLISLSKQVANHDPVSFFSAGKKEKGTRIFWSDPLKELTLVGVGEVLTIATNARDRFRFVENRWQELLRNALIQADDNIPATGATLLGGFSFDPLKKQTSLWESFPAVKMTLPKFLLTIYKGNAWLTIHVLVQDHDDPFLLAKKTDEEQKQLFQHTSIPHQSSPSLIKEEIDPQAWLASVEKATKDIQNSEELEKIVLARELRVFSQQPFLPETILKRLQKEQPSSYLFAFESGNDCFIGATPEQLVKRIEEHFLFTCLAGSMKRGENKQEDEKLGAMLLHDQKNRHEHQLVVDMIKDITNAMCKQVNVPDEPILYKMRDIQHLYTPITAKAKNHSLLSIVEALHPTPALGGAPQKRAVKQLRETEDLDRGWYAAPIGWLDHKQNGEFAAAIRSALLKDKQASLFAGCGIVADSEPVSEYNETNIKFRPMLSALGESQHA